MARIQKIDIKVDDDKYIPEKAHDDDACFDLKVKLDTEIEIIPGEIITVDTGVRLSLPKDWEAEVRPRSGLASKFGLTVVNAPGTIDAGYTGPLKVVLGVVKHVQRNETFMYPGKNQNVVSLKDGMRIAQIAFRKVPKVKLNVIQELQEITSRGEKGMGSTGV